MLLAATSLFSLPARAVTSVWGGGGGDGNWTTVANWTNSAAPGAADTAIFTNGSYASGLATTLGSNWTANALVLSTTNTVSINGSTLTLGSGLLNRTTTSRSNQTINSAIALGADGLFIVNGAANSPTNLLINGSIGESGGSRSLTVAGLRILHLMGGNTFTGSLLITNTAGVIVGGTNAASSVTVGSAAGAGGTLLVGANYALGNGTLTLNTNAVISGYAASRMVGNAVIANGNFTVSPSATVNTSGGMGLTFTNALTLNANLTISNALSSGSETLFFAGGIGDAGAGRSLTINASGGTRRFLLTNSTYTGATVVNNGTLLMSGTNATSSVAVNPGATLVFLTDNPFGTDTMLTVSNATLTASNGTRTISNPVTFMGVTNFHQGADLNLNGSITLSTNMVLNVSSLGAGGLSLSGSVGESVPGTSLTIMGTRTLALLGSNSYSGGTYLRPVTTLTIGNSNAFGTGTVYANAGSGQINLYAINTPVIPNAVLIQGTNAFAANSTRLTFTNQVVLTGDTTLLGNHNSIEGAAMVFAGGFNDQGSNFSLTFVGGSTRYFIISNASSYSGGTFIRANNGNVIAKLAADNGLGTNSTLRVDASSSVGSFNLNGFNQTVGALSGTGTIALGSGTLVTGDDTDSTFAGYITGAGGTLVKKGAGVFTLGGSNAYNGGTLISNGTLKLGVQTAILSNRAVTVAGGTYDLGGFAAITNGVVTLSSGAISNGTLVSSSNLLATDSGTIFANLAGNGGLIKTGAGTLSLNGNSIQAGATQVSNGVLRVNGVLSGTAGLTVHSNATLGGTGSVRGVDLAAGGILAPGNSIGTLTVSNLTLNTGSLFDFELAATNASDQVVDLGTLALAQLGFSNFSFTTNAGFGEGTYTLVDAALHSGSFAAVSNESFYGYLATISLGGTDGHDLVLGVTMAIPEPSALLALTGGTLVLAMLCGRRRKE